MNLIKAFRKQNFSLCENLTKHERRTLYPHVEHHSGGLVVAGKDVEGHRALNVYAKIHDTWGDPDDVNEGPIVVHLYDPDDPIDPDSHLSTDVTLYFRNGSDAVDLFHNDEALAAIWKATR